MSAKRRHYLKLGHSNTDSKYEYGKYRCLSVGISIGDLRLVSVLHRQNIGNCKQKCMCLCYQTVKNIFLKSIHITLSTLSVTINRSVCASAVKLWKIYFERVCLCYKAVKNIFWESMNITLSTLSVTTNRSVYASAIKLWKIYLERIWILNCQHYR